MSLFSFLASDSKKVTDVINEELSGNFIYAPGNSYGTDYKYSLLRNPHISKNESVQVRPLKNVGYYRNKYFSHLTDVIMVPDNSDIPMRLGGADFDGDMVKTISDNIIISYLYTKENEPEYYGKSDRLVYRFMFNSKTKKCPIERSELTETFNGATIFTG